MIPDSLFADSEPSCDFFSRMIVNEQMKDFSFPRRKQGTVFRFFCQDAPLLSTFTLKYVRRERAVPATCSFLSQNTTSLVLSTANFCLIPFRFELLSPCP